ncbi:hypothetical protein EKTHUN627_05110 [Enterobacter kobei]|nr:hypothetical protein EKTHUN627_05110 [Enterobacter kobei]
MEVKLHVQTDHADDFPVQLGKLVAHIVILQISQIAGMKRLVIELCLLKFADEGVHALRIISSGGAKLAVRHAVSPSDG